MGREEIFEGLRFAVARGESLEKAMITFLNAGYAREDIENAARAVQALQTPQPKQPGQPAQQRFQQQPAIQQPTQQTYQPPQQPTQPAIQQPPQPTYQPAPQQQNYSGVVQRVSQYGPKPNKTSMTITIILFTVLLFLFGILAAVIIFKDELSSFFNTLLSATLL